MKKMFPIQCLDNANFNWKPSDPLILLGKNITCFRLVAYLDSDTFVLRAMLLQHCFWLMLFNEGAL